MRKTSKKGFTIVELVIVIAIIAILAAILIPTFANVISDARDSAAASGAKGAYTEYITKAETLEGEIATDFIFDNDTERVVVYKNGAPVMNGKEVKLYKNVADALNENFNVADDPATTEVNEAKSYTTEEVPDVTDLYFVKPVVAPVTP